VVRRHKDGPATLKVDSGIRKTFCRSGLISGAAERWRRFYGPTFTGFAKTVQKVAGRIHCRTGQIQGLTLQRGSKHIGFRNVQRIGPGLGRLPRRPAACRALESAFLKHGGGRRPHQFTALETRLFTQLCGPAVGNAGLPEVRRGLDDAIVCWSLESCGWRWARELFPIRDRKTGRFVPGGWSTHTGGGAAPLLRRTRRCAGSERSKAADNTSARRPTKSHPG